MKPYSVFTPEFNPVSGGIRVMWGLFGWLLAKGQLAQENVRWHEPYIAIYPEITWDNPLGAGTVVRYILNKPGFMASYGVPGPTKFDPEDKIFVFSKLYDTFGVDSDHILFLPILNLQLFKDLKKKRTKTGYFVGKGTNMYKHPTNAVNIGGIHDQTKLAETLNECQVMYTYENPTAMNEIARLCGCPVIFIPEGSRTDYTKEQLTNDYEPGMDGVAFGENEEPKLKGFRDRYIELVKLFDRKLDRFIELTND